jgi:hypothetical protein
VYYTFPPGNKRNKRVGKKRCLIKSAAAALVVVCRIELLDWTGPDPLVKGGRDLRLWETHTLMERHYVTYFSL